MGFFVVFRTPPERYHRNTHTLYIDKKRATRIESSEISGTTHHRTPSGARISYFFDFKNRVINFASKFFIGEVLNFPE